MTPDKQKSLDAMRTFARDVERERGEQPDTEAKKPAKKSAPVDTKPKAPKKEEPKPVPVKHIKVPDSKDEPKDKPKPQPKQHAKEIPPFHELQKAVNKSVKEDQKNNAPEPAPKKQKSKGITPSKPVAGGTVITDNKKDRPAFFAELKRSLQEWVTSLKQALSPKKKNTYAVRTTERRKGVVQKATSKTGTIFSADNETLREQIKARQRAEKGEHEDINWSPYTEAGFPLLEGEESESDDPRISKIAVTPKTQTKPKSVIKSTEKIPELQEEPSVPDVPEPREETPPPTPAEEKPEATPAPEPAEVNEQPFETETAGEEPDTEESAEIEDDELAKLLDRSDEDEAWQLEDVSLKDTNTLAMLLVGVVLGVSVIGFVLFGIFGLGSSDETATTSPPEQTLFVGVPLEELVVTNQTFNQLVSSINSTLITQADGTTVEYKFVNSRQQRMPAGLLMKLMKTRVEDGFADSITTVRFVHTADDQRAVWLRSSDSTTGRGGMLNWEDTLLADVGPLLDVTGVTPSAGDFVDTQLGTLDVRALVFDEQTLLVYALVNETDIIIASDIAVLSPFAQN